jgi:hypothetical protein
MRAAAEGSELTEANSEKQQLKQQSGSSLEQQLSNTILDNKLPDADVYQEPEASIDKQPVGGIVDKKESEAILDKQEAEGKLDEQKSEDSRDQQQPKAGQEKLLSEEKHFPR